MRRELGSSVGWAPRLTKQVFQKLSMIGDNVKEFRKKKNLQRWSCKEGLYFLYNFIN